MHFSFLKLGIDMILIIILCEAYELGLLCQILQLRTLAKALLLTIFYFISSLILTEKIQADNFLEHPEDAVWRISGSSLKILQMKIELYWHSPLKEQKSIGFEEKLGNKTTMIKQKCNAEKCELLFCSLNEQNTLDVNKNI